MGHEKGSLKKEPVYVKHTLHTHTQTHVHTPYVIVESQGNHLAMLCSLPSNWGQDAKSCQTLT